MDLRQGKRQVADYAIEFRTLSAECGWNIPSLLNASHHGLANAIKDQLVSLERPPDLDSLIALAIKIDNRLREREKERARLLKPSSASAAGSGTRPGCG